MAVQQCAHRATAAPACDGWPVRFCRNTGRDQPRLALGHSRARRCGRLRGRLHIRSRAGPADQPLLQSAGAQLPQLARGKLRRRRGLRRHPAWHARHPDRRPYAAGKTLRRTNQRTDQTSARQSDRRHQSETVIRSDKIGVLRVVPGFRPGTHGHRRRHAGDRPVCQLQSVAHRPVSQPELDRKPLPGRARRRRIERGYHTLGAARPQSGSHAIDQRIGRYRQTGCRHGNRARNKPMISITMLTRDSARFLDKVLPALKDFDEIIVLDNGSTDNTMEIAARYPNVKILQHEFIGFGPLKNLAAQAAKHDWILNVDSDEVMTPELAEEISAMSLDPASVYTVPILNHYRGKPIRGCGWGGMRKRRLYNKS